MYTHHSIAPDLEGPYHEQGIREERFTRLLAQVKENLWLDLCEPKTSQKVIADYDFGYDGGFAKLLAEVATTKESIGCAAGNEALIDCHKLALAEIVLRIISDEVEKVADSKAEEAWAKGE